MGGCSGQVGSSSPTEDPLTIRSSSHVPRYLSKLGDLLMSPPGPAYRRQKQLLFTSANPQSSGATPRGTKGERCLSVKKKS